LPDVIVIGGGIAGSTSAYFLARNGVDVTLVEQFELGSLASGTNAGSLHAQIQPEPYLEFGESWARGFLPALELYKGAMSIWQDIEATLGRDLEVLLTGGIAVARNDDEMRMLESKVALERQAGLGTELLGASELRDRAPYLVADLAGGACCPTEGQASPLVATRAFAATAQELGATVLERHKVTAIRRHRSGYEIDAGSTTLTAPRVVNAAGNDAARIARLVGGRLDLQSFPIQLSVTEPVAPLITHLVYSAGSRLTLKQSRKGTVLIGGGWPATLDRMQRPGVDRESLYGNLAVALDVVPALAGAGIVRTWAAEVNGNDSWLPVIGEVPGSPGFFMNYVPWMGFSGAPMASSIVANLVQGRGPGADFPVDAFAP
jgi:glycine/D-amino acid oxidase-like deaminating enzyme